MSDTKIRCKGCSKELKSNTVLKHLSQKPICKDKYSQLEFNDLIENSRKRSRLKEKAWKEANYQNNKEEISKLKKEKYDPQKRSEKHKIEYNRAQIKRLGQVIQNQYQRFLELRSTIMNDIISGAPSQEVKDQIKKVHEILNERKIMAEKRVEEALQDSQTIMTKYDYHIQLFQEWNTTWGETRHKADEILKNIAPEKYPNPKPKDEHKIECKSCHEKFEENSILKHLAKVTECKNKYEEINDLQELQEKALKRVQERSKRRYQDEKEMRSEQYREERKVILKMRREEANLRQFKESKDHLKKRNLQYFEYMWLIKSWKSSNKSSRGAQCRREIYLLKQSKNPEVKEAMLKIENDIEAKISELEACYMEVAKEVEETICHYECDEAGIWRKQVPLERHFIYKMFESAHYHIDDEIENLYWRVLQTLKENSKKEGRELGDLYMPYKLKIESLIGVGFTPKKYVRDMPNPKK